jgi:transposase InsO family protein
MILARDPLYTKTFRTMLEDACVEIVRLPSRFPNLNFYAERRVRSLRKECLSRVIPLDENHLRRSSASYVDHYHVERNHQGLDNRLNEAKAANTNCGKGCIQRLGELLNFYDRDAA